MAKRQHWQRPQSITDDKQCPICGKKLACKEHRWAYRKWFEGIWQPLERPEGTSANNAMDIPPRPPHLLRYTSDYLDGRFYQTFDESFFYNRAATLLYAVLSGDNFKTRANEQIDLPIPLDDGFLPSLRADLYFSSLQQFELLLVLLLAPYQPLSHWVFLSEFTTKEIMHTVQNILHRRFDELKTRSITTEREFIEQALYSSSRPPQELASQWNENLDNIWRLIEQMATKYVFAVEHAAYRPTLHVKTTLDLFDHLEAGIERNGANLLGALDFANDAFSFIDLLNKGETERSVMLTSKQFNVEESFFYIGAAQAMLKIIKSTRLAALRGEPPQPAPLLFPDLDKNEILQLTYQSSFSSSHVI